MPPAKPNHSVLKSQTVMRFFKYSLIFVVCSCALISASPAPKIRKSLKRSTEVPEALPKIEETGESKDNNRTKKATTFCVEIKGEKEVACEPQVPQEPQKVEQPPQEPTFLVFQPPDQEPEVKYVQVPIPVISQRPSPAQLIVNPGYGHQPHSNSLLDPCNFGQGFPPGSNRPGFLPGSIGSGFPPHFGPGSAGFDFSSGFPTFPGFGPHPGSGSGSGSGPHPGSGSGPHPGSGSGTHPGSGPGSNKPGSPSGTPGSSGPNSPMTAPGSKPHDDCADGQRPGTVIMMPGGPGSPIMIGGGNIPHFPSMGPMGGQGGNAPNAPTIESGPNGSGSPSGPGSNPDTCLCVGGSGQTPVYAFMRNNMNEQDDMMMPGMDARMTGMMGMDPMTSGMGPGSMDMRSMMMEPMTDASGMPRTHYHHYIHHDTQPQVYSIQAKPPHHHQHQVVHYQQPMQYYQPIQLNQPCAYSLGLNGFRDAASSEAMRAGTNGNQGMMGPGGPTTGDMQNVQNMGPMDMQRASQNMPKIFVTPPNQPTHLHPGQNAGNPCNEGKAKHWQIRSTDAGAESHGDANAPVALEASADSPTKAQQLTPSQMLNQMRAASPAQRISPVMQNDNDANVQMSVIGPGGQSYLLGGGKSELDGEERREELSKREVEVSNNKLE